jgi:hypothetical protein
VIENSLGRKLERVEITIKKQLLYSTKFSKGWFARGQQTDETSEQVLEIFRIKAYFDFRFRFRYFPFNQGFFTSVSAPKSRDITIVPFKTNSV